MAKKLYDAVATVGEYTDKNGQNKKRYVNVGAVFEHESGGMSLKLETIPVGDNWSGWISFFVPKEKDGQQSSHNEAKSNAYQPKPAVADFDDDIPF